MTAPVASSTPTRVSARRTLLFLPGVLLSGYGALVALRLLAHESLAVGLLLLAAGALLVWSARPRGDAPEMGPPLPRSGPALTLSLGILALGGVTGYAFLARSSLTLPELAIVAYGVALIVASRRLGGRIGRARVRDLVAWSIPLLAAPLGIYALDAALDAGFGRSPLDAFIERALVAPMATALALLGFDAAATGQTVLLDTPRGTLALSIGVVCAGLQPGVLFLGVLGLHAWREATPPRRWALYLALGLLGVYAANLVRLVALALVGYHAGGSALLAAHAHAGWIVFVGWMLLFWGVVLRKLERPSPVPRPSTRPPA